MVEIVVPTKLDEEQRELVERLDDSLESGNFAPRHEGLFSRVRRALR